MLCVKYCVLCVCTACTVYTDSRSNMSAVGNLGRRRQPITRGLVVSYVQYRFRTYTYPVSTHRQIPRSTVPAGSEGVIALPTFDWSTTVRKVSFPPFPKTWVHVHMRPALFVLATGNWQLAMGDFTDKVTHRGRASWQTHRENHNHDYNTLATPLS